MHGRWWFQLPSLDGGSRWLTDKTGEHSPPGAVTFTVDPSTGNGWRDYAILEP